LGPGVARDGIGAPGFLATSAWLRLAFSELSFEELDVVAGGDQVVSHVRMTGIHVGPLLPTSLSGDLAAALREHGSATLDEHDGYSHQPLADAWAAVSAPCRTAAPLTLRN